MILTNLPLRRGRQMRRPSFFAAHHPLRLTYQIRLAGNQRQATTATMHKAILVVISLSFFAVACEGGCDMGKLKDKAMQYKDKIPTDKIPTKLPK